MSNIDKIAEIALSRIIINLSTLGVTIIDGSDRKAFIDTTIDVIKQAIAEATP